MFFTISKNKDFSRYTIFHDLSNGYVLGVDEGWEKLVIGEDTIYYKGYSSELQNLRTIVGKLSIDPKLQFKGNFCAILDSAGTVKVLHDDSRAFHIWAGDEEVSNLEPVGAHVGAGASPRVIVNSKPVVEYGKKLFDLHPEQEYDVVLQKVHDILNTTFENFLSHNTRPLKVFLSGGLDCALVYSYLKKFTSKFELVDYEYIKHTDFYRKNFGDRLKNFEDYQQIHSWGSDPASLVSGAGGGAYCLKGHPIANLHLMSHGTNMNKLLADNKSAYMYKMNAKKELQRHYKDQEGSREIQTLIKNKDLTKKYILRHVYESAMHWHLDSTITFTPYKDMRIPELILSMPFEEFKKHATNGKLNRDLISMNDPGVLNLIDKHKTSWTLEKDDSFGING
jgi:hypothetical protein